jgi:hypothetical protein
LPTKQEDFTTYIGLASIIAYFSGITSFKRVSKYDIVCAYMSTPRQQLAASKILENPRNSMGAVLRESGYSEAVATHPKEVVDSKGFQDALDGYGLTNKLIIRSLVTDIKKKPQNRARELELAAKLKGLLKEANDIPTFDQIERAKIDETSDQIKRLIGAD